MTDSVPEVPKKQRRVATFIYLILILLLMGSNGYFAWLWKNERGRVEIVTVEKESISMKSELVKQELTTLKAQYETMKITNTKLQQDIDAKRVAIEQLLAELENNKGDEYVLSRLKKETETLRDIMQHFVHEIDSLNTSTKIIIVEKEKVKKELKVEQDKNAQLSVVKKELENTVKIASLLKPVNLSASGISEKRGGKHEVETSKAKKTDKIKISFSFAENTIAKKGDHIVYVRIVTPDGKDLTLREDSSHVFKFGGSRGYWAAKKVVSYDNEETGVLMYAHSKEDENFANGKYIVQIACDGETIGTTTFQLE